MSDSFFQAGFREIGRKFARAKLRRQMREQDVERRTAFIALGEQAWEARLDLAAFGDVRDRLVGLESRAGDLSQTKGKLETDIAALDAERRAEQERFAGRRKAVLDQKAPIDAALNAKRSARGACEQTIRNAESRIVAIDAALKAPPNAGTAQLMAEQSEVRARLDAARAELPGVSADEQRLEKESFRLSAEISTIDAEQKAALSRIDAAAQKVKSELRDSSQQSNALQTERTENMAALGQKLYEAGARDPALADRIERIAAIDRARAHSASVHAASMSETQAMPAGSMLKFWSAVIGLPLLLVIAGIGIQRYRATPEVAHVAVAPPSGTMSETDEKMQIVQSFIRKGRDSELRQNAIDILKDDILAMGATANPVYLPTLVKVLRSREPELRAAAADAIGMIGPTPAETAELARLRDDDVPEVATAARVALSISSDAAAKDLAK
jgi:hypothetical protein